MMMDEQVSSDEMDAVLGEDASDQTSDGDELEEISSEPNLTDEVSSESKTEEPELPMTTLGAGPIQTHDWGEKRRLSSDQLRVLNDIHDQFAKSYGPTLSIAMKQQVEIKLEGEPKQVTYGDFISKIPNPTSLNRFILPPLEGNAALHLDLPLALAIVDRMLGGTGEPIGEDDLRAPTAVEERVLQKVVRPLLGSLREAWSKIHDIHPAFTTAESIPYYLQLSQMADDVVIVAEFSVAVRDEFGPIMDGTMSLCYPYILLQPIVAELKVSQLFGTGTIDRGVAEELRSGLEKVKVPIYCNLVRDRLRLQDLLDMEDGDVLTFRTNLDQAAEVVIGSTRVFWGRPGMIGRRHAVKVESFIAPDDEAPATLENVVPTTTAHKSAEPSVSPPIGGEEQSADPTSTGGSASSSPEPSMQFGPRR